MKTLFAFLTATVIALPLSASTRCQMRFSLEGWSIFYKQATGTGTITCDNGQRASVSLEAKGGGLTAGRTKIRHGLGKFSPVSGIGDLFGSYGAASATAAAGKAAGAAAMTKGEVSLALSGKGEGIELGIAFGKFTIKRR